MKVINRIADMGRGDGGGVTPCAEPGGADMEGAGVVGDEEAGGAVANMKHRRCVIHKYFFYGIRA